MSEKPSVVKVVRPGLGDPVVVITREKIAGQNEHAAIVTQVHSDDVVNVIVMPGTGQPYPIASVSRVRHSTIGALCWRPRAAR